MERLDKRWMVVALHLERNAEIFVYTHHTSIFARAIYNILPFRWEFAQMESARFIAAMLAPHSGYAA
jgi:hypothetical protein